MQKKPKKYLNTDNIEFFEFSWNKSLQVFRQELFIELKR
ncbi:hypothetical protein LEP1GSC133_3359 [Leptospira borgpetersenii serovar Pomona str. 200901868]|nr:hypothetical protein LEP1GSC133_3359 [Leptospira borgpetersenii serovar Pomona str. 200901868]